MFKKKYDTATQTFHKNPKSPAKPKSPAPKLDADGDNDGDSTAPVGSGGRFAALKNKLSQEPGVNNPGAVAASIGRKKYGAAKFNSLSHKGS